MRFKPQVPSKAAGTAGFVAANGPRRHGNGGRISSTFQQGRKTLFDEFDVTTIIFMETGAEIILTQTPHDAAAGA